MRFLGLVPNDEVARLQAAADLFVLSSVLEATPTVALEALASRDAGGLAPTTPAGVELAGIFGDDVTVVPKQDPQALAAGHRSPALSAAPADATRQTAGRSAERFRLPGVADRYLALYQRGPRRVRAIDNAGHRRRGRQPLPQRVRLRALRVPAQRQGDRGPGAGGGRRSAAACSTPAAAAAAPRSPWPRRRRFAVGLDLDARFRDSGTRLAREKGIGNAGFAPGRRHSAALPRTGASTWSSATP